MSLSRLARYLLVDVKTNKLASRSQILSLSVRQCVPQVRLFQRGRRESRDVMFYVVSLGIVAIGVTFAAIPAYRIFCEQTSFGGLTQLAKDFEKIGNMKKVEDRLIRVQFNSDVPSSMRWEFKPLQHEIYVHPGETALAFYTARNPTDHPIVGISSYNLTPFQAAYYFNKIQCFCFEEQILNPGEQVGELSFLFLLFFLNHFIFFRKSRTVITDPNVDIPEFINHFWEQAKQLNSDHPCYAFHSLNSAHLVGVFDYLNGSLCNFSDSLFRLHWRFATDLPEMQTIIVCDGGRYALWRDEPRSNEILIVFASNNEHFPKIEIVGDNMEHVLIHLAGKDKHIIKGFLPQGTDIDNLRKQIKAVCARRRKKKLGKAPHDPGIWVKVVNDIGYRPITEDPRWFIK
uniref:Cytochrome c oxidase assembly protein COX11, mitochondrial n=1 Tax=Heterorhabditis bacteriophora TaxID=37862 RepID=A0A1I7WMB2_HETBA